MGEGGWGERGVRTGQSNAHQPYTEEEFLSILQKAIASRIEG